MDYISQNPLCWALPVGMGHRGSFSRQSFEGGSEEVAAVLFLLSCITDERTHHVALEQPLDLQLLHLSLGPPSALPFPGVRCAFSCVIKEVQLLLQDVHFTEVGGSVNLRGFWLVLVGSC